MKPRAAKVDCAITSKVTRDDDGFAVTIRQSQEVFLRLEAR